MGPTSRRLLYHLFVFCLLNSKYRALCNQGGGYKKTFPVSYDSPSSKLMNTLMTVGSAKGVLPEVLSEARSIWPFAQSIIPPIQEIESLNVLNPQCNIPTTLQPIAQSNYIIPNSLTSLESPARISYTSPQIPTVYSSEINPYVTSIPIQKPGPISMPYFPEPIVMTPEINPTIPFNRAPPTSLFSGSASCIPSPISTVMSSEFNPTIQSSSVFPGPLFFTPSTVNVLPSQFNPTVYTSIQTPTVLSNPISFTPTVLPTAFTSEIDPILSYNTFNYEPPISSLTSSINSLSTVSRSGFNHLEQHSAVETQDFLADINPFAPTAISTTVINSETIVSDEVSYTPFDDFQTSDFFAFDEQSSNLCSCPEPYFDSSIEIETEINTVITNVDITETPSNNDLLVPYSLEINIPIVTTAVPVTKPACSLPNRLGPPKVPLLPTLPPAPPIVIQNSNSKSNSLSTLLLGLLLLDGRRNNHNCGNSAPTPIPYPIPVPTYNPIVQNRPRNNRKTKKCKGKSSTS